MRKLARKSGALNCPAQFLTFSRAKKPCFPGFLIVLPNFSLLAAQKKPCFPGFLIALPNFSLLGHGSSPPYWREKGEVMIMGTQKRKFVKAG